MLVLSRRLSESITIGDGVTVTILGVSVSGKVQIGVEAPSHTKILRTELTHEPNTNNEEQVQQ